MASAADARYEAWVRQCGGTRVIRRLLVANNGMAAAKFIMSIRSFLFQNFGDDQPIHIIAMATPEDMKASAKHLALSSQSLGMFLTLMPHIKAVLAAYVPEAQRSLLKEMDSAATDYEEHQQQLFSK